jgi:6,7-dimethyl-8-ribityllumazine synthase
MLTKRKTEKPINHNAAASRFAIVCARYNARYTDAMLGAALDTLAKAGAPLVDVGRVTSRGGRRNAVSGDTACNGVTVVRVPGAFEIPVIAAQLARSGKFDAVIALGCIIQGKTDHARLIGESVANALQTIAVETGVPCIFSIVTAASEKHARERCLGKKHNRGVEAARTAIEMANVKKRFSK